MKKKKVEQPLLPSVESTHFVLDESGLYWLDDEGVKRKIVKAGVCANGVRDLCIYWKGPRAGDVSIGKIVDVPKERILWIPKGDIFWARFEPPLGDRHSFYIDIADSNVEELVREIMRRFPSVKGSNYEMYGGKQYL